MERMMKRESMKGTWTSWWDKTRPYRVGGIIKEWIVRQEGKMDSKLIRKSASVLKCINKIWDPKWASGKCLLSLRLLSKCQLLINRNQASSNSWWLQGSSLGHIRWWAVVKDPVSSDINKEVPTSFQIKKRAWKTSHRCRWGRWVWIFDSVNEVKFPQTKDRLLSLKYSRIRPRRRNPKIPTKWQASLCSAWARTKTKCQNPRVISLVQTAMELGWECRI